MKVILNPDEAVVAKIKEGLEQKDGYCPCRLAKTPENKCICKEFREQIADPDFEGFCHCMHGVGGIHPRAAGQRRKRAGHGVPVPLRDHPPGLERGAPGAGDRHRGGLRRDRRTPPGA